MNPAALNPRVNTKKDEATASELSVGGWLPDIQRRLAGIVGAEEAAGGAVVLDFDNTLICRDLGDAVLGQLASNGLHNSAVAAAISPPFCIDGTNQRVEDSPVGYYEALQQATSDHEPRAAAYAWAVQVMAGRSPADVVRATRHVLESPHREGQKLPPFAYPDMLDLVGYMLTRGFRLYIISATNVWSTRWAVKNVINPALNVRFGSEIEIRPECVVGISLLMKERASGLLYSDAHLVRSNPAYRSLDPETLGKLELTPLLSFPVSTYAGKVGCLRTLLGNEQPLLAAGDSDNDLPLLAEAKHRLWIARLEDASMQEFAASDALRGENWLVQPVLTGIRPGFIRSREDLESRTPPSTIEHSIDPLRRAGHLVGF